MLVDMDQYHTVNFRIALLKVLLLEEEVGSGLSSTGSMSNYSAHVCTVHYGTFCYHSSATIRDLGFSTS